MLNNLLLLSCLAVIVLTGCQKELITKQTDINSTDILNDNSTATVDSKGILDTASHWYGTYAGLFKPYPSIQDADIIKDGIAKMPYLDRQFNYSIISYDIPAVHNIYGDSIAFEARVKNTRAEGFNDYDLVLQLIGEAHSAEVHFVADADFISYTKYYVGQARHSELLELVHYFGVFQTLKLAQKKYYTAVYINDILVYKFKYGLRNSIGRLQTVKIAFKGYGSCTAAALKNSYTGKPIFSEDFNKDGKSNIIYY